MLSSLNIFSLLIHVGRHFIRKSDCLTSWANWLKPQLGKVSGDKDTDLIQPGLEKYLVFNYKQKWSWSFRDWTGWRPSVLQGPGPSSVCVWWSTAAPDGGDAAEAETLTWCPAYMVLISHKHTHSCCVMNGFSPWLLQQQAQRSVCVPAVILLSLPRWWTLTSGLLFFSTKFHCFSVMS